MSIVELREKVHQLVDKAPEGYLVEVIDLLESENKSSYNYTASDLDRFSKIAKDFENDKSTGMSVEDTHHFVRNTFKNGI